MSSIVTPWVVAWAAQECAWQQSGELSVTWMVDGWLYAHRYRHKPITYRHVLILGAIVEPRWNSDGIRTVNVRVGEDVKLDHQLVERALTGLVDGQPLDGIAGWRRRPHAALMTEATDWFRQYEEIHPFRDGNGRTGSILYNWLRGTLPVPVYPPNLWHDPRR